MFNVFLECESLGVGLGLEALSLESKPAIEIEKFHMRSIRDMRSLDRIVTMLP